MAKLDENIKGPWDAPILTENYENHYYIRVTVYDPKDNNNIIAQKVIDYGSWKHRKFLGKLTHYAMENRYIVETERVEKD